VLDYKIQCVEKRRQGLQREFVLCAYCRKLRAVEYWKQYPICGMCLNPDLRKNEDYQSRLRLYWCGLKTSMQQIRGEGGWGDV
jgi:uncharacterized CHY-type Zn-finger protein